MQLKTDRFNYELSDKDKQEALINYIENLRDEIDFRLTGLKEKLDTVYKILKEIQGGSK